MFQHFGFTGGRDLLPVLQWNALSLFITIVIGTYALTVSTAGESFTKALLKLFTDRFYHGYPGPLLVYGFLPIVIGAAAGVFIKNMVLKKKATG